MENTVAILASLMGVPVVRWSIISVVVLYVLYIYVMRLKHKRERKGLTWQEKVVGYPVALAAYVLDVAVNMTVASVVFLDPPKELTVSRRIDRYLDDPWDGYRGWLTRRIARLLNKHDPGHVG